MDQQIVGLTNERQALIAVLTASGGTTSPDPWAGRAEQWPTQAPRNAGTATATAAAPTAGPAPAPVPYTPKKSASGQQVLLGVGALMVLSAASFFLLVVWIIVGIVGQALIMVPLTGAAVAGSVVATRRRHPAAAETAAVIATGFLFIDLSAAHALGLAGLDRLSSGTYRTGASLLGGALLVWWDRLVPRAGDGIALRRVLTYRPAAAIMFASVPWFAVSSAAPEGAWLTVAMLGVATVNAVCGLLALRVDEPRAPTASSRGDRWLPVSTIVLFGAALLATLFYALTGLVAGYDPSASAGVRYTALVTLMLFPVGLAVLSSSVGSGVTARLGAGRTRTIPAVAVAWAGPVLGIALMDATHPVLAVLATLVAVAVVCVHLRFVPTSSPQESSWLRALSVAAYVAQPLLLAIAFLLTVIEHESMRSLVAEPYPRSAEDPSPLWMVIAAVAWFGSSLVGAVRRRSTGWASVAKLALLCTLVAALWESDARTWMVALLIAFAGHVALACVAVRRGSYAIAAPLRAGVDGDSFWAGVDRAAVVSGVVYVVGSLIASFALLPGHQSFVLVTVGVLTLVYAASPCRLPLAYIGSLAISAGTANLLREAAVETTEAYTAPLVLLLAAIGFVQWRRDKTLPTFLTMGPALAVAMGPSLLTSLGEGDVTQGGPLIAYVPGFLILGVGGLALLAAGIAWERAVVAGRRAAGWYSTLR